MVKGFELGFRGPLLNEGINIGLETLQPFVASAGFGRSLETAGLSGLGKVVYSLVDAFYAGKPSITGWKGINQLTKGTR